MRISQVEIGNFRKLVATRIAFAHEKTVFVGANNSGKTSAMTALSRFFVDSRGFSINDFSLAHWQALNAEGDAWEAALKANKEIPIPNLSNLLPQLDVWLEVGKGEMHYVQKLLPTLDWKSGSLGVRLRYEPDDWSKFQKEYLAARVKAAETTAGAIKAAEGKGEPPQLELWPLTLIDFLDRRVRSFFKVKAYLLDPAKVVEPSNGIAAMQELPAGLEPVDGNPLDGLIQIDEISAQRGFGSPATLRVQREDSGVESRSGRRLSTQLRSYYDNHLDWQDTPELSDIKAIEALDKARKVFDERLSESFGKALKELQKLGYPGISDPKLKIATKLQLQDGLNHASAVQYEIPGATDGSIHRLPEDSNGLGYQNLVSIVFGLMSCRDAWMRVGKASVASIEIKPPPPLHLMLVEEPEAYLHAQVQQVFIKHAYDVLRNDPALGESTAFRTQLVVSTHSSHVAHACDFSALRYFRRLPSSEKRKTPTACVVNLSNVFGKSDQTEKFVTRYLKATHCDLFFADAAIFIEGNAERILVPHFVEELDAFEYLRSCYITWLEIGGSHAHRFKALVEALGLTTLIITDLDAKDPITQKSESPSLGEGQEARNETLRTWTPNKTSVDELIKLSEDAKALVHPNGYAVRAAYQTSTKIKVGAVEEEVLANTFEDALLYRNIAFFKGRVATGLAGRFQEIVDQAISAAELTKLARGEISKGDKAEFALELLYSKDVEKLQVPVYIEHGLLWLIKQLERKEADLAPKTGAT
ncbi:AAA family ATPase [Nevskia soli]|uniref:AAA family ATPase n=1 Tax=Nevskia soli TaxID=418856 RepID=UPI00056D3972|nr:AAA family ATPase [Nevskia soli]